MLEVAGHRDGAAVVACDQLGVGDSSGSVPPAIEVAAADALTFLTALGHDVIDVFSSSMGGMIARTSRSPTRASCAVSS